MATSVRRYATSIKIISIMDFALTFYYAFVINYYSLINTLALLGVLAGKKYS